MDCTDVRVAPLHSARSRLPANRRRHEELYRQRRRERFLTEAEFRRLGGVLEEAERTGGATPEVNEAIRLLILTGCRRSEILGLRWWDVDLEAREPRLADTGTGPRVVPLSPSAVELLAGTRRRTRNAPRSGFAG